MRLNDGTCGALSHDAQRVICITPDGQLNEVPTKTGEAKTLTHDQLIHSSPQWLPDEKRMLFVGQQQGHGQRIYVQDLAGGPPRAITPEGVTGYFRISPDGAMLAAAMGADYKTVVYRVNGNESQSVAELQGGDAPVAWSQDSRFLYCLRLGDVPAEVFRVELASGHRTLWKKLAPPESTGITFVGSIYGSADWKSYVYTFNRKLDDLYMVEGLH